MKYWRLRDLLHKFDRTYKLLLYWCHPVARVVPAMQAIVVLVPPCCTCCTRHASYCGTGSTLLHVLYPTCKPLWYWFQPVARDVPDMQAIVVLVPPCCTRCSWHASHCGYWYHPVARAVPNMHAIVLLVQTCCTYCNWHASHFCTGFKLLHVLYPTCMPLWFWLNPAARIVTDMQAISVLVSSCSMCVPDMQAIVVLIQPCCTYCNWHASHYGTDFTLLHVLYPTCKPLWYWFNPVARIVTEMQAISVLLSSCCMCCTRHASHCGTDSTLLHVL